jgi:DNA-binding CsgD family transcriptional regulator
VLRRAVLGDARELIAEGRRCSVATVKKHIANILQKTGEESFHVIVERVLRELAGIERLVSERPCS